MTSFSCAPLGTFLSSSPQHPEKNEEGKVSTHDDIIVIEREREEKRQGYFRLFEGSSFRFLIKPKTSVPAARDTASLLASTGGL